MSLESGKYKIRSAADPSTHVEIEVSLKDYKEAAAKGISLANHLNLKYGHLTDSEVMGTVFNQAMANSGLFLQQDFQTGIKPPTLQEIFEDNIQLAGIVNTTGDSTTPSSRLLFPEVVLQLMESELRTDESDFFATWNKMFANTLTVTSERYDQPLINANHNENTRSRGISQGTEPANMVSITTSDRSYRIPVKSIGLSISDQAMQATTLDLVSLIMGAQSRGERLANAHELLNGILNGDVDMGETGIASDGTFQALDAGITTAGTISHKALVKYLRLGYKKIQPNLLLMDLDTAFAVEARIGKPTETTAYRGEGSNFALQPTIDNLLAKAPPILIVDTAVIGANTIIGIDTTRALRRVINVNAAYSAIEQFVMRRLTMFRVDYGETANSLWKEAFAKRTLTV